MAQNNIPVSIDFFKKYTYYEECVDCMLKLKANGNQQMYESLINNKEARERALRSYYEAFYLRPAIRKSHHIRLKAAPKNIKDKLLLIPAQGACASNADLIRAKKITTEESQMQDAVKGLDNESSNAYIRRINNNAKTEQHNSAIMLAAKYDCEEVCFISDDDEPLASPGISSSIPGNNKINLPAETQKDKEDLNQKDIPFTSAVDKNVNKKKTETSLDMQQNSGHKANAPPRSATSCKKSILNYKDLIPYMHCCPLTYKEFRKYSNISELVREFCEQQKINGIQERMILQRAYVLFYLAPEHRKTAPINKIQLLNACPSHIKEKFFTVPTNLYLKEDNDQNVVATTQTDVNINTNNANQEVVVAAAASTTNEQHANEPDGVSELGAITADIPKSNEENTDIQKNIPGSSDAANLNITAQAGHSVTNQKVLQAPTTASDEVIISLPVSLDVFKTYTHYEAIVQKLFKIKAQHNKDLYYKYMSSTVAFDKTLQNYYHTFYMLPAIREICPIELKPMSDLIKRDLLSVPEGVKLRDWSKFKLEQLVEPELVVTPLNDEASSNAETFPVLNSVENKPIEMPVSLETPPPINSNNSSMSSPNSSITTVTTVNTIASPNCENKSPSLALSGIKRTSNELMESSSAKRNKIEQTGRTSSKRTYKELLPFAHCCPISFSVFNKYTNIAELFNRCCQKRYKNNTKLPYMLQRAYILFYLAPEYRSRKPFNKLKIKEECPANLRDKMFEIPTDIYDLQNEQKVKSVTLTQIKMEKQQEELLNASDSARNGKAPANNPKEPIEILENRLLPSITQPLPGQSKQQSNQCSNTSCAFHHISYLDFMKSTNVLSFLPEPQTEITVIQNLFKKFMYKVLKNRKCDDDIEYMINLDLLGKFVKYTNICEKCENDLKPTDTSNLDTTAASSISDNERLSSVTNEETVVERCVVNDKNTLQLTTKEATGIEEGAKQVSVSDKSSISDQTEKFANNSQTQRIDEQPQQQALWKFLRRDKIFSKFCQKLLSKLNQSFDETVDFSSESYTIFLQCNDIPLKQILNDFCENNEDIAERVLNNLELSKTLQCYYYFKYLTNENFAAKYPPKVKEVATKRESVEENSTEKSNEKVKGTNNAVVDREETKPAEDKHEQEGNSIVMDHDKSLTSNNALEKAKRIFFRNIDKSHTLAYVLRTSFDCKQLILKTVLRLTFEEFLKLTNIYEGKELYEGNHIAKCMYRYVFRTPLVWPTNLYIPLKNLCKFLLKKNINFEDYSQMLTHVSPKLLHWSDLLSCTNILECIKNDFEQRTGNLLDTYDIKSLKRECIEYYNRCWKHEKWLGGIPIVYEDFYNDLLDNNSQGDNISLCEWIVPDDCNLSSENKNNMEAASKQLVRAETTVEQVDSASVPDPITKESNCPLLPNTQQQVAVEVLKVDESVSNNSFDNNNNVSSLNVSSSSTCEIYDLTSVNDKLIKSIKTEPTDAKLLSNILFYEDENSDIKCLSFDEEIVDLDNTMNSEPAAENLPPAQIDFEETLHNHDKQPYVFVEVEENSSPSQTNIAETAQNHTAPFILVNSNSSSFLINLTQPMPSPDESGALNTQQFMQPPHCAKFTSTQLNQLPDVTLTSSSENEVCENAPELQLEKFKVTDVVQEDDYICIEIPEHEAAKFSSIPSEDAPAIVEDSATEQASQNGQLVSADFAQFINKIAASIKEQQQQKQQEQTIVNQTDPCTSTSTKFVAAWKSTQQTHIPKASVLPICKAITNANTANNKISKNIATIKPLKNFGLVPQIQHVTRPLQTVPAHATPTSTNDNQVRQPVSAILPPASVTLRLTPTKSSSDSASRCAQNSSFQLQLSNLGTHIYISQEFNKNCSVFDNTSLLRIVDRNSHQSATNLSSSRLSQSESEELSKNSSTLEEQQQQEQQQQQQLFVMGDTNQKPVRRIACSNSTSLDANILATSDQSQNASEPSGQGAICESSSCPDSGTQPSNNVIRITTTSDHQQQTCPSVVTPTNNNLLNTNDKVNNIELTHTNNNSSYIITLTIRRPLLHSHNMTQKLYLYRRLLKFHYFKKLTSQHISKYLLPSLEVGKSYTEALVACDNFKTRISNRSISALFPFWSRSLQRDFLLVLDDLAEFHYVVYDHAFIQNDEDLRVRILSGLLHTAPPFSLCQFTFDANNSEFSYCETVKNSNNPTYKRKPFKCLTNALNPQILKKLREMKKGFK